MAWRIKYFFVVGDQSFWDVLEQVKVSMKKVVGILLLLCISVIAAKSILIRSNDRNLKNSHPPALEGPVSEANNRAHHSASSENKIPYKPHATILDASKVLDRTDALPVPQISTSVVDQLLENSHKSDEELLPHEFLVEKSLINRLYREEIDTAQVDSITLAATLGDALRADPDSHEYTADAPEIPSFAYPYGDLEDVPPAYKERH